MSSREAIDQRVKNFVADLETLVRAAALEAVQTALGGTAPAKGKPGRKPGRPAKAKAAPKSAAPTPPAPKPTAAAKPAASAPPAPPAPPAPAPAAAVAASAPVRAPKTPPAKAAAPAKPAKRKKGQKRTQAELASLQAKLDGFVRANDGKRIEEISKALGIATSELVGPMKRLLEEGQVRSTGQRRATRYYSAKKK